jgi:hypothetical protein
MKHLAWKLSALAGLMALATAARGGELENSVEARWRGAWVLTGVDTYSDCSGFHTTNDVSGMLVRSKGHYRFKAGELARVQDIDLKRSGLEISLSLPEPLLVSYQDGPFTLYNEIHCQLDVDLEVPRTMVKGGDLQGIEALVQPVLQRFNSQDEASGSRAWNRRERADYPEDYDRTLARHAAWKAEQANAAIQARLDQAHDETARITDRISSNPDYLKGFAAGIESVKSMELTECADLLDRSFQNIVPKPGQLPAAVLNPAAAEYQHGFQDGGRLLYGLQLLQRLPGCMVSVPEVPDDPSPSSAPRR